MGREERCQAPIRQAGVGARATAAECNAGRIAERPHDGALSASSEGRLQRAMNVAPECPSETITSGPQGLSARGSKLPVRRSARLLPDPRDRRRLPDRASTASRMTANFREYANFIWGVAYLLISAVGEDRSPATRRLT